MLIRTQNARQPFWAFWRPVMALIIREMSTTYGRYPIGFVWMFLEPLGTIMILALVFSYALASPPLGDSFALFYATGYLPYIMYVQTQNRVSAAIAFSRTLLKYPRVTVMDSIIARAVLSFVTIIIVSTIVIIFILLVFRSSRDISFGELASVYLLSFGVGVGVGCLNCYLFSRINFWKPVWGILNGPFFIVSGIFFTYEVLPPALQGILWYNPIMHVTGMARAAFYPNYDPVFVSVPYILGFTLCFLTLGIVLLRGMSRDYVDGA